MKYRAPDSTKRGKKEVFQCNFVPGIGLVPSALPMKQLENSLFMHQSVFLSQEDEKSWK